MSAKYINRDDIESHQVAMHRVVVEKLMKQEAIDDRKMRAFDAAQKAFSEAIKSAKDGADRKLAATQKGCESRLAAMQRDFECLPLLRQVYHKAPDDVFELILSKCRDVNGQGYRKGGLNAFRLVNKRCKGVVEACVARLTNLNGENGPENLPFNVIQRCRRIKGISCDSRNLRSLEGCPTGLKWIYIADSPDLVDLSPLASCTVMKELTIIDSSVTDISVVASMPRLQVFRCESDDGLPSIEDLSPLLSCPRLESLRLFSNAELEDISPLSACTALVHLDLTYCTLVSSLAPLSSLTNLETFSCHNCDLIDSVTPVSGLVNLRNLMISNCPCITSLTPLAALKNLTYLCCHNIHPQTSLLPLISCAGLKKIECDSNAMDLQELRRRRPQLKVKTEENGFWTNNLEELFLEEDEGEGEEA